MMTAKLKETVNLIISHHREIFGESPTPMKLQKLAYYSQGYFLAENGGSSIFDEDFQAWVNGPVVPGLYREFREFGWRAINVEVSEEYESLRQDEVETITSIVEAYGRFDGAALSTMTHRESPWLDARGGIPETMSCSEVIPKTSIQNYFQKKLSTIV